MIAACGGDSDGNGSGGDGDDRFGMEDLTPPSGFELTEGLVVDPQSVPGSEGGYRVIYNGDGNIQMATYVFPSAEGANEYFDFVFRGPGASKPSGPAIGDEVSSVFDENIPHVLLIGFRRQNVVGSMQLAVDVASGGPESRESEALALMRELDARVAAGPRN